MLRNQCLGILSVILLLPFYTRAQRIMERLDRGLAAVPAGNGKVFVSWRSLVTDAPYVGFNVYRSTEGIKPVKLNKKPVVDVTGWMDEGYDSTKRQTYSIKAVLKGKEGVAEGVFDLPPFSKPFFSIELQTPEGYAPNDGSLGDLDGDGKYELIIHQAGRGRDNSQAGVTDPPVFQAYKLDGTLLWSINLGKNIREGAHYTQFMVYDFDGDGRAEIAMKTADGTIDGKGDDR